MLLKIIRDLKLPNKDKLPLQGAMFIGEKGRLLLPHFMELPKHIVDGKYVDLDLSEFESSGQITDQPVRDYGGESYLHYHQFVDACLGKDTMYSTIFIFCKINRNNSFGCDCWKVPWENSSLGQQFSKI